MSSGSNDEKFQQGASVGGNRSNRFNQSTNGKIGVYVVKQKLKLEVKTGDITKCEIDGIVCPQTEYLSNLGRIAKEIEKIGGHEYKTDLLKLPLMKLTGAKRMMAPTKCPWKYVIQSVPPRWNLVATRNPKGFEQNLKDTVCNILIATKFSRIKTLAVPLMGIAEKGETPVETFAEQFAKAVLKQVEEKDFTVEEIHVMVHDMNVVKKIVSVLDTKETEGIKKVLKSGHRGHTGRSEEAMEVDDVETGDVSGGCCICMDKLDNPKTLACGHVFCTDCIEQQFKYKPSCPQCGQIHGVVTGTQPDGRMNIKTKKHSLPGYSGTNTIEIEYMIYSGKQGFGYPDETYLDRVLEELAAKGITEKDLQD
ncbi:DTX [Mytilus edulis]|uniref:E3 ubiquitin-protein ligase n=1 Tax=Mytilus edulis TaxID=6550 RepID=A0A8S3VPV6_MYTED|nr:DTX [Mytilus edulis]